MKKRVLTFVTSYLMLAAFIGSAEAKMIHIPYYAGAGAFQFSGSASRETAGSGWTLEEPAEGMDWLLAYYYGIEGDTPYVELEQSTEPSNEALAADEESGEGFSLAESMWFNQSMVKMAYGDSYNQTDAADQLAVYDSTPENSPQAEISATTIPRAFFNPPSVVVYQSNKEELTPLGPPAIFPSPSPDRGKPQATPVTANIPPSDINPPPPAIPIGEPLVPVSPNGPGKPGYFPPSKPGWELPNNNGNGPSSAPVPEPATTLLLSSSLVGLAFTRMRKK